jgi:YidC/Oxa1 family membrane protein insertase
LCYHTNIVFNMSIWNILLYQPLTNLLIFFYQAVANNLGLAIILATAFIRLILLPLTLPSLKAAQKLQELKPQLDKLKKKYANDKQALALAQVNLYKQHKINPGANILPTILQILVVIALFRVFTNVLGEGGGVSQLNELLYPFNRLPDSHAIKSNFFYLDLTQPDAYVFPKEISILFFKISKLPGLFLIIASVLQFLSSYFMSAGRAKTTNKTKSGDEEEMMMTMQKQMLFLSPVMTLLIGLRLPSGLVLYWITYSIIMIIQQYYFKKAKANKK